MRTYGTHSSDLQVFLNIYRVNVNIVPVMAQSYVFRNFERTLSAVILPTV